MSAPALTRPGALRAVAPRASAFGDARRALGRGASPRHLGRRGSSSRRRRATARRVLDAEGIPWETDGPDDFSAPSGLAYDGAPGESLVELAERLHDAVRSHLKDGMYDECVVDMSPFGIEECYGDVSNAVAEVMVAATSVETAGQFNMALRRKELRRLRAALWDLRVVLESKAGGCTITIRHRLESLRSASLDVCHPKMRAADAPSPSAIPNFQTVHQRFEMDAVPSAGEALFGTDDFDEALGPAKAADPGSSGECELDGPEVAFYRGGQPTAEGRSWLVSKGFKTVVDLRFEDRENQWTRPLGGGAGVGKLGEESLEVIHLPVTDMTPPSYEDVEKFIAIANDRTKRPMFVHCKAGIGRTGSVVSCWRISRGMPVDDALELESLNCDFGSLAQEAFVREFADRLARKAAGSWDEEDDERAKRVSEAAKITAAAAAEEAGKATDDKAAAPPPPKAAADTANASAAVYVVEKAPKVQKPPPDPSPATPTYEGAEYFEEDASSSRAPTMRTGPEGMGSGGMSAEMLERGVSAVGEHSRLDAAPDMYVIRTDGFTCTREEVDDRMLKISHPSTQQLVLVWRKPPKRIFILKKLGGALLGNLVEVAHAFVSMGFEVIVEEGVMNEMRSASEALDEERLRANEVTSSRADEVREAVLRRAETLAIDEKTGRIPETAWGTIDLVVCLGGDGVILHASKLFQGPVPPLMGFHFGSMGFLTNHPPDRMAQSLLQAVGRGPKKVANVKGGIPITLRMRLQCTLVKKKDSARNGGSGAASHSYTVLNEVLVDRGPSPFLSKIEAYDRGQLITTIQADGVMLATATGSTAYSVSAGGSMVHPNVPAILMTPICPHTLSFRPVVLPDSVEVELRVADDARQSAWVSFDGKERCELCSGDSIFIRMSEFPVPTVNYEDQTGDFIGSLRRCLRWNERDEQKPLDEAAMRELRKIADGD